MAADPYEALAADYHWFYDDTALRVGTATAGVRAAFRGLPDGARILDAACGIGIDVAALSRRGFDVVGADASAAMLAQARSRAAAEGVAARFVHCTWEELTDRFPTGFDAVLCTGNALSHSPDSRALTRALSTFADLLAPDGLFIADVQHWEVMHDLGDQSVEDRLVVEREGLRCVRRFDWHVPQDLTDPFYLDVVLGFSDGADPWERTHRLELHAFTRANLRQSVRAAGLQLLTLDARDGEDRYSLVAQRPAD